MTKKEKLRFAAALVLSVFFGVCSFFLMEAAICEFCMMPSKMTEAFYGFLSLWMAMMELVLLLFGIGTLSAGALAVFFAYSLKNHAKTGIRRTAKSIFAGGICLMAPDVLSLALLLL